MLVFCHVHTSFIIHKGIIIIQSVGFWITIRMKSLSGATIISCFLERTRRNVMSLDGSRSRTTLRALSASWLIRPAYWTVVVLSSVDFTGIPNKRTLSQYGYILKVDLFVTHLHCWQQLYPQHLCGFEFVLAFLLLLGTVNNNRLHEE